MLTFAARLEMGYSTWPGRKCRFLGYCRFYFFNLHKSVFSIFTYNDPKKSKIFEHLVFSIFTYMVNIKNTDVWKSQIFWNPSFRYSLDRCLKSPIFWKPSFRQKFENPRFSNICVFDIHFWWISKIPTFRSLRFFIRIYKSWRNKICDIQEIRVFNLAYSTFYLYRSMEGKLPGVCQKQSLREPGIKIIFPRGKEKFSRGVIPVRGSLPGAGGSYLENWFPKGHFWHHLLQFQAQKWIQKIAFGAPVWIKNGIIYV